ncbi:hypothetical protein L227DRAFT_612293 [Lentinus tigrinus ALCF2SS1-6]|uniref:Uncharacterized protein n=1 Tax=Lentinus tigrinus ALCF2SS1-6 TaxID=1328759 RepID=A0A5C2S753_9APHY|nr:hypothetical protein L227DRAFT_612293 [Lentinus tigrinus ALCF2SS1-6]
MDRGRSNLQKQSLPTQNTKGHPTRKPACLKDVPDECFPQWGANSIFNNRDMTSPLPQAIPVIPASKITRVTSSHASSELLIARSAEASTRASESQCYDRVQGFPPIPPCSDDASLSPSRRVPPSANHDVYTATSLPPSDEAVLHQRSLVATEMNSGGGAYERGPSRAPQMLTVATSNLGPAPAALATPSLPHMFAPPHGFRQDAVPLLYGHRQVANQPVIGVQSAARSTPGPECWQDLQETSQRLQHVSQQLTIIPAYDVPGGPVAHVSPSTLDVPCNTLLAGPVWDSYPRVDSGEALRFHQPPPLTGYVSANVVLPSGQPAMQPTELNAGLYDAGHASGPFVPMIAYSQAHENALRGTQEVERVADDLNGFHHVRTNFVDPSPSHWREPANPGSWDQAGTAEQSPGLYHYSGETYT